MNPNKDVADLAKELKEGIEEMRERFPVQGPLKFKSPEILKEREDKMTALLEKQNKPR